MLRIRDLHAGYGATPILFGVSLEVNQGEAVALLGKNGMGKTTLMKAAMGFIRPSRGSIEFEGHELTRMTPHEIAWQGIGLVPENRRLFPGLTVSENLELGLSAVRRRSASLRRERFEEVFRHFPRLSERIDQPAQTLSGGEQQMLAIARVMMAGARHHPDGRADSGTGPRADPPHPRHDPRADAPRHHRAARRAERPRRPVRVRPRLHHGEGRHRLRGSLGGAAREPGHP